MGTRTRFVLLVEWGCFACIGEKAQEPVDIIIISADSLHADHVGSYGYHRDTTPTLDRLAAEGALFEKVVAESSWTLPTHVTMITGLSSLAHAVNHFVGSQLKCQLSHSARAVKGCRLPDMGDQLRSLGYLEKD